MTVAHVEALRLENHFMKQSLGEKKSDQKEVAQMQSKYHQVLDLTEQENKRLKSEVVKLSRCIEMLKEDETRSQGKLHAMGNGGTGSSGNSAEMDQR